MTRPPTQSEIDYGCALDITHSSKSESYLIITLRIIAAVVIGEAIAMALWGLVP